MDFESVALPSLRRLLFLFLGSFTDMMHVTVWGLGPGDCPTRPMRRSGQLPAHTALAIETHQPHHLPKGIPRLKNSLLLFLFFFSFELTLLGTLSRINLVNYVPAVTMHLYLLLYLQAMPDIDGRTQTHKRVSP